MLNVERFREQARSGVFIGLGRRGDLVGRIFTAMQRHLADRQTDFRRQYAFGGAFGQIPEQFVVAQFAGCVAAQHVLIEQGLDEVAEQALVEKLRRVEAMQDRQALGHGRAEVFQLFGAERRSGRR